MKYLLGIVLASSLAFTGASHGQRLLKSSNDRVADAIEENNRLLEESMRQQQAARTADQTDKQMEILRQRSQYIPPETVAANAATPEMLALPIGKEDFEQKLEKLKKDHPIAFQEAVFRNCVNAAVKRHNEVWTKFPKYARLTKDISERVEPITVIYKKGTLGKFLSQKDEEEGRIQIMQHPIPVKKGDYTFYDDGSDSPDIEFVTK